MGLALAVLFVITGFWALLRSILLAPIHQSEIQEVDARRMSQDSANKRLGSRAYFPPFLRIFQNLLTFLDSHDINRPNMSTINPILKSPRARRLHLFP